MPMMAARARRQWVAAALVAAYYLPLVRADELPFVWFFDEQDSVTQPSCASLAFGFELNANSSIQAVPPYSLIVYKSQAIPHVYPVDTYVDNRWSWRLAYAPGSQLLLSFVDSQGNSGGVSPVYTIVTGNGGCDTTQATGSYITYILNPSNAPATCQTVVAQISGGSPPYTVSRAITGGLAKNTTFPNSTVSYQNTLSGGATYMVSISDSNGVYANSTGIVTSGGGGDASCLIDDTSGHSSNGTHTGSDSGSSSSGGKNYTAAAGGAIAAIAIIIALGMFWYFRRRFQKQKQQLLEAQAKQNGGGGYGNGSYNGPNGPDGNVDQKTFASIMGQSGGGWRPESPVEYPGMAGAPVRFRVTNPDDDAISDYSIPVGTYRNADNSSPVRDGSTYSGGYGSRRSDNPRRQSLMEEDHNALYPPTISTRRSGGSNGRKRNSTLTSVSDDAWPTFSSNASSTEDHYMDHPASSAGNIASKNSTLNTATRPLRGDPFFNPAHQSQWSSTDQGESDIDDHYSDSTHSPATEMSYDPSFYHLRSESVNSNADGSPFADSQRIRDAGESSLR